MKSLLSISKILPMIFLALLPFNRSNAQCSGGVPPTTISYNNSSLTGFGNDYYEVVFPKFDPAIGNLYEVTIEKTVTVKFGFYLENGNAAAITRNMRFQRSDEITSSALLVPITYSAPNYNSGLITLQPTDGLGNLFAGPDYYSFSPVDIINNVTQTYHITNVAPFMGTGSVSLDYNTTTAAIITNGSSANITTSNSVDETIQFRITYNYCTTWLLPSGIKNFTAKKETGDGILLTWLNPNDDPTKKYVIEKSIDGRNFIPIGTMPFEKEANGNYSFLYSIQSADKGYLLFRIKEINADGSYYYSQIRSILLDENKTGIKVYPTLVSDYVQVSMPGQQSKDVLVKLVTASGQVLQQKRANTNTVTINFERHLPQGMYFVQVTDMRTHQQFVSKIFAQ